MLLSTLSCSEGTVDFVGIVTERGKLYEEALARSRVEYFQPVDLDVHVIDCVITRSATMQTYKMIG